MQARNVTAPLLLAPALLFPMILVAFGPANELQTPRGRHKPAERTGLAIRSLSDRRELAQAVVRYAPFP
jgi:hypothetical protein